MSIAMLKFCLWLCMEEQVGMQMHCASRSVHMSTHALLPCALAVISQHNHRINFPKCGFHEISNKTSPRSKADVQWANCITDEQAIEVSRLGCTFGTIWGLRRHQVEIFISFNVPMYCILKTSPFNKIKNRAVTVNSNCSKWTTTGASGADAKEASAWAVPPNWKCSGFRKIVD